MTMEVILSTVFGRAVDVQGGKGGKLFESAVAVFAAFAPPKDDEPVNIFRMLQFVPCMFLCGLFLPYSVVRTFVKNILFDENCFCAL